MSHECERCRCTHAPPKLAYSVAETCDSIGITRPTLYKLIADGRLRSVKIGTRRIITADSLNELLNNDTEARRSS